MTATWTANRTWTAGELVTASIMNTYVRDNLDWLKTPLESGGITFAADFTTTSTTYVDVTGVTTTITTKGGGLDVFFRCTWNATSGGVMQLLVDGASTAVLGTGGTGGQPVIGTMYHHIAALSAGSHTIKVQAKTVSGTLTVKGTTAASGDPQFFVREAGA